MSDDPVQRRYCLGISSIPPVEEVDGEGPAEAEIEYEHEGEEPPEP